MGNPSHVMHVLRDAKGKKDAEKMGLEADRCFAESSDGKGSSTIVMSTGVIGQR